MKLKSIFNCSNDMALAANVRQYFPPKRIQQMESDLEGLADYWEEGPWGWSLATKQRYKQMGVPEEELPSDEWLNHYRQLSSREFACTYIKDMLQELNDPRLLGHEMTFHTQLPTTTFSIEGEGLKKVASEGLGREASYIFKSPWSSSGRGVFVSNQTDEATIKRLQGYLNTQGGFVMDKFYANKALDFAMEFMICDDVTNDKNVNKDAHVTFLGYSVFNAADSGAYGYNYVESKESLRKRIPIDDDILNTLIDYHRTHLSTLFPPVTHALSGKGLGDRGRIPVGIDMILCSDGTIHPCIEINLRMNMGILAIKLWERFQQEKMTIDLTPPRAHGFQAKIDEGKLRIIYNK